MGKTSRVKRLHRFFCPQINTTAQTAILSKQASHHAKDVLRLRKGDHISVFDGKGKIFLAEIKEIQKNLIVILTYEEIEESCESSLDISLGQALSKGHRMDFTIQKSVELGVSKIYPLFTEKSLAKIDGDRLKKKKEHWQNLIVSACEQCGRNLVPEISFPLDLKNWVTQIGDHVDQNQSRIVFDPSATQRLRSFNNRSEVIVLIGPEGGFTDNEILQVKNAGFELASLGPRVLRTETAGVAALAIIQSIWGDL